MQVCSPRWGQCGGLLWQGATCCTGLNECITQSKWYAQCIPTQLPKGVLAAGSQCGGAKWLGDTTCEALYTCQAKNKFYSSCQLTASP